MLNKNTKILILLAFSAEIKFPEAPKYRVNFKILNTLSNRKARSATSQTCQAARAFSPPTDAVLPPHTYPTDTPTDAELPPHTYPTDTQTDAELPPHTYPTDTIT